MKFAYAYVFILAVRAVCIISLAQLIPEPDPAFFADHDEPADPFELLVPEGAVGANFSAKGYEFEYPVFDPSKLPSHGVSVYDGDTVVIVRDLGENRFDIRSCRIMGVDAPELRVARERDAGLVVKQKVVEWIGAIEPSKLRTKSFKLDKYAGRYDGDLYDTDHPDRTLSKFLIENDYAKPYDGGTKEEWTDEELSGIQSLQSLND